MQHFPVSESAPSFISVLISFPAQDTPQHTLYCFRISLPFSPSYPLCVCMCVCMCVCVCVCVCVLNLSQCQCALISITGSRVLGVWRGEKGEDNQERALRPPPRLLFMQITQCGCPPTFSPLSGFGRSSLAELQNHASL